VTTPAGCAIAGVGHTAYSRGTERSTLELHLEASLRAIEDAGLRPSDIDGVMPSASARRSAEDFISNLGLRELSYSATLHMGGASTVGAVQTACLAIEAGLATAVLVPAGRRGYSGERISTSQHVVEAIMAHHQEFEIPFGNIAAAQWFAQAAQRHMHVYGTTSEQLGHVSVTMREHAQLNPGALMHGRPITLGDHQESRMISTPFRLLDCSLESDGAGAVVVTSADRAADLRHPVVQVLGSGQSHGYPPTSLTQKPDMAVVSALGVAGDKAFDQARATAGVRRSDIDCFLVHEGFSWYVIAGLEALGFVKPGEGGPFVEEGHIKLGGRLPVNTSGGALSEGHVSGVNHLIEAVRQLRRDVPVARQVADCSTAVVATEGNFFDATVAVLGRAS